MNIKRHSGNSHTNIINSGNTRFFRKTFSKTRSVQYFTEYLCNRYLSQLNPCFVAKIVEHDHKNHYINYILHQPSPISEDYAKKYLNLISAIHFSSLKETDSIKLLASQPLNDLMQFSRSFIGRINDFRGYDDETNSLIRNHLRSLKIYHLQLIESLDERYLYSKQVFSHADSGLHNCLTDHKGNIMLSDLEYAGLDSPVKQCMDYLLHPKTQAYAGSFVKWLDYFTERFIAKRDKKNMHIYSALLALKWSLIMLNEYQSNIWNLRLLSNPSRAERKKEILMAQYKKSLVYYVGAKRLADGHKPYELFRESERHLLSHPY